MHQLILLFFLTIPPVRADDVLLCPEIRITGDQKISLTEVEKRLVCGDPETQFEGWKKIPLSQAIYNLKNYLQDRGYHRPTIHWKTPEQPETIVEMGPITRVTEIQLVGMDDTIGLKNKRQILDQPLTPNLLENLENWAFGKLQSKGYACPKITSEGDPETGKVQLQIQSGPLQNLVSVFEEPVEGLEPNLLRRYDAFKVGDRFNGDLLTVTQGRVSAAGIVENTRFITRCEAAGVLTKQTTIAGPPRLLSFRVGANTEGLILGRVAWRNTRLGHFGSQMNTFIEASTIRQTFQSTANWYVLPEVTRFYLNPLAEVNHRSEQSFESIEVKGQVGAATSFEHGTAGGNVFLGPTYSYFHTVSGAGAPDLRLLSLESRITLKTHSFEFHASNPSEGVSISFISDLNSRGFYSDVTAQRMNLRWEALWNLFELDPPLWVVGVRGGFGIVLTDVAQRTSLPAPFLQYLGGSADIRGFKRLSLPLNSTGGLTSAFVGTELRLTNLIPYGIDPFIFTDLGGIGSRSGSLDSAVYWSPGLGIRWASPIGAVRTTFAEGFSNGDAVNFQFYFSIGEEF